MNRNHAYNRRVGARRLIPSLLALVLCAAILLPGVPSLPFPSVHAEERISDESLEDLRTRAEATGKALQNQIDALSKQKSTKETLDLALLNFSALSRQYRVQADEAERRRQECENAANAAKARMSEIGNEREALYENYLSTLRTLRESRDVSTLEMIFNADSLEELLSAIERAKDLSEYKSRLMDKMDVEFTRLDEEWQAVDADLQKQTEYCTELSDILADIDSDIRDTELQLNAIVAAIGSAEKVVTDLADENADAQEQLHAMLDAYEKQMRYDRAAEIEEQKRADAENRKKAEENARQAEENARRDRELAERDAVLQRRIAEVEREEQERLEAERRRIEEERIRLEEERKRLEEEERRRAEEERKAEEQRKLDEAERLRIANQTLLWPLDYPLNVRGTSPYGYRFHPITGTYKFHSGLDLAGPDSGLIAFNPIYAAMEGDVITAIIDRGTTGYGTYIVIEHGESNRYGGSISTLYAHCEEIYVEVGQHVTQGQLIGRVGTTGSSTGYHLHFEVRQNGSTTNPASYEYITELGGIPVLPKTFMTGVY